MQELQALAESLGIQFGARGATLDEALHVVIVIMLQLHERLSEIEDAHRKGK